MRAWGPGSRVAINGSMDLASVASEQHGKNNGGPSLLENSSRISAGDV